MIKKNVHPDLIYISNNDQDNISDELLDGLDEESIFGDF